MSYIEPLAVDLGIDVARDRRALGLTYEIERARLRYLDALDKLDVAEELACDEMVQAIQTGNPNTVGRLVLRIINGYCYRLAEREVV